MAKPSLEDFKTTFPKEVNSQFYSADQAVQSDLDGKITSEISKAWTAIGRAKVAFLDSPGTAVTEKGLATLYRAASKLDSSDSHYQRIYDLMKDDVDTRNLEAA